MGLIPSPAAGQFATVAPRQSAASLPAQAPIATTPGGASPWQVETNAAATPATRPPVLLQEAIWAMQRHRSVSATIRQEVDLFGKHLIGSGSYAEQRQGDGYMMRLDLRIQNGDQTSSLVQVAALPDADGRRFLWTKRKLFGEEQLTRVDLARALRGLQQAETEAAKKGTPGVLPGIGGLPKLLSGLATSFEFTSAQLGHSGQEQRTVWRLQGQWKPEQLLKMLPEQASDIQAGKLANLEALPQHVPDHVVLLLGYEDHFPYRVEYRRIDQQESTKSGKPVSQTLVSVDLYNVVLDAPINPQRFIYSPGDLEYADETSAFLQSLGLAE